MQLKKNISNKKKKLNNKNTSKNRNILILNTWRHFVSFASIVTIAEHCPKLRSSKFARAIVNIRRSKGRNATCLKLKCFYFLRCFYYLISFFYFQSFLSPSPENELFRYTFKNDLDFLFGINFFQHNRLNARSVSSPDIRKNLVSNEKG